MNYFTYWKFDKVLDDEMCERILNLGADKFKKAQILSGEINKDIRDSSVVWLTELMAV